MSVVLAFARRDWLVWSSYRLAVLWQVIGVALLLTVTYFVGTSLGHNSISLQGQGENYVAFALAGIAFTDAFSVGLTAFPRAIRDAQLSGTLEAVLLAPIGVLTLLTASTVFHISQSLLRTAVVMGSGVLVFGFWHHADVLAACLVFVPASLAFIGLGLLSGSFIVMFKQGDPVVVAYAALSGILGGTVFPVTALPDWMQSVAGLLPLTHALAGVRLALGGVPAGGVAYQITVLSAFAAVLLPGGLITFHQALRRAKKGGSLVQY